MYQRHSPIQSLMQQLDPTWGEMFQARVPLHFGDPPHEKDQLRKLALCDLSFLPKLGLKGPHSDGWLRSQGLELPSHVYNVTQLPGGGLIARVDRHEFFLEEGLLGDQVQALSGQLGTGQDGVYRVNRQDGSLLLSGEEAARVLAQTCAYRFAAGEGDLVLTRVAAIACSVLPLPVAETQAFRIWCSSSYAEYLWQNLLTIVRELGGEPVGIGSLLSD